MKRFTTFTREQLEEHIAAIDAAIGTFARGRPRKGEVRAHVPDKMKLRQRRRYYLELLRGLDDGTCVSLGNAA